VEMQHKHSAIKWLRPSRGKISKPVKN